jgi:hypothetical protein
MTSDTALTVLSLGAGVQSTTLALLAAEGVLPRPDVAIFADTEWEPAHVYRHLERLSAVLHDSGIELVRVQQGDLRRDTLARTDFLRLPAFVHGSDGKAAMLRRQCTERYKLDPIRREIRRRLGARTASNGAVMAPPRGAVAEQWIGFSTDEIGRVKDEKVAYLRNRYPLLELNMSRKNCEAWLARRGWGDTPKSACIACPFHGNRQWRELRDTCVCGHHRDDHWRGPWPGKAEKACAHISNRGAGDDAPADVCRCTEFRNPEWLDAVEFDRQIRQRAFVGPHRVPFVHRSLLPLDEAPIDQVQRKELLDAQGDLFDVMEHGTPDGCSPFGCRSGEPVDLDAMEPRTEEAL